MNIIQSITLGIVEGITEFIPVSSTGHLLIVRNLLGLELAGSLAFDAVLQFSSSLALIFYFRKDILVLFKVFSSYINGREVSYEDKNLLLSIIIGSIPAILFGLVLQEYLDTVFRDINVVTVATLVGAILIFFAEKINKSFFTINKTLTLFRGFIVGLFQCLAFIPGMSRSGSTISGGLISGLSRTDATRFSFLLSIPVLFGAGLKELISFRQELFIENSTTLLPLIFGSVSSFVVGLIVIHYFIQYLKTHSFKVFIIYRILLTIVLVRFF